MTNFGGSLLLCLLIVQGSAVLVTPGAQVLKNEGWARFTGRKIGILSNPTGVLPDTLEHIVDAVHSSKLKDALVAVFGPEHGFRGDSQAGSADPFEVDQRTGLPVFSLYGKRGAALEAVLRNASVDTVVFDIQDVGTRFYTYMWTLWDTMEACANLGYTVFVLDRPNPLGGLVVEGPVLKAGFESGVGRLPIALRHGMTAGELATMFAKHFLNASQALKLEVVKMEGYARDMTYADTGLPWVMPSPNMPTPHTALVYPGFGMVEGSNCSEGRGTTRPFEITGASFLYNSTASLAERLNKRQIPGVQFREVYFVPTFSKDVGRLCRGTQVYVTDPSKYSAVVTALHWFSAVKELSPSFGAGFAWRSDHFIDLLAGTSAVREGIDAGLTPDAIAATWTEDTKAFMALRENYLLY